MNFHPPAGTSSVTSAVPLSSFCFLLHIDTTPALSPPFFFSSEMYFQLAFCLFHSHCVFQWHTFWQLPHLTSVIQTLPLNSTVTLLMASVCLILGIPQVVSPGSPWVGFSSRLPFCGTAPSASQSALRKPPTCPEHDSHSLVLYSLECSWYSSAHSTNSSLAMLWNKSSHLLMLIISPHGHNLCLNSFLNCPYLVDYLLTVSYFILKNLK